MGRSLYDSNRMHELWGDARGSVAHWVRVYTYVSLFPSNESGTEVLTLDSFFEAGFFAGTVFYLTLFYNRNELGFRIALYFGSAVLAAAFSGILAYGVFQIKDTSIAGWQYLFIIEYACLSSLCHCPFVFSPLYV